MLEYYVRVFRNAFRGLCRFTKEQISIGLIAGVVSTFVGCRLGTVPRKLVWVSALVCFVCYVVIFLVRAGWGIIRAPVDLDQKWASEVGERDASLERQASEIKSLKEDLSRKHPHDEHQIMRVKDDLEMLDERDQRFLREILDCGQLNNTDFQMNSFRNVPERIRGLTGSHLLVHERVMSKNGAVETDRVYRINPEVLSILRDLLHPSRQPVT